MTSFPVPASIPCTTVPRYQSPKISRAAEPVTWPKYGEAKPPTGDHLSEYTSELKPGDHIVEFAAAGPKNYRYRTKDGKVECKVRWFALNTRGQEQLNFELLKQNVIDEVTDPGNKPRAIPVHNPHKIRQDVNTKQLETVEETK